MSSKILSLESSETLVDQPLTSDLLIDSDILQPLEELTLEKLTDQTLIDDQVSERSIGIADLSLDGFNVVIPMTSFSSPRAIATLDNDRLIGGNGRDVLYGEDGNDSLYGYGGDDRLYGGSGNDLLIGGSGNDILSGGTGQDSLHGEEGDDVLNGDDGNDLLNGGHGKDLLYGGSGSDIVYGEGGDDTLYGEDGNDHLDGGNDNDLIFGGAGSDGLTGGSGNDTLRGGLERDILTGNIGNDTFVFQYGSLTSSPSRPGDSLVTAPDRITDFQIGHDRISLVAADGSIIIPTNFTRAANSNAASLSQMVSNVFADANGQLRGSQRLGLNSAVLVQLHSRTPGISGTYIVANDNNQGFQPNNDLVINITGFHGHLPGFGNIPVNHYFSSISTLPVGTPGNDNLSGSLGNDTIYGEAGNDIINGLGGSDLLYGGIGNDVLNGEDGFDVLNGGLGNDTLNGGNQLDVLNGDAGNDILNGDAGDDILNGGAGNDILNGGLGSDFMYGEDGNDLLDGGNLNNGNDNLLGGSGNDTLLGWDGNDTLTGGDNTDTLTGGQGNDTFTFQFGQSASRPSHSTLSAPDHITDFEVGIDKILLVSNFNVTLSMPNAIEVFNITIPEALMSVVTSAVGGTSTNTASWINYTFTSGSQDSYLVINDGVAGFDSNNDLVIKMTGYTGSVTTGMSVSQVFA